MLWKRKLELTSELEENWSLLVPCVFFSWLEKSLVKYFFLNPKEILIQLKNWESHLSQVISDNSLYCIHVYRHKMSDKTKLKKANWFQTCVGFVYFLVVEKLESLILGMYFCWCWNRYTYLDIHRYICLDYLFTYPGTCVLYCTYMYLQCIDENAYLDIKFTD